MKDSDLKEEKLKKAGIASGAALGGAAIIASGAVAVAKSVDGNSDVPEIDVPEPPQPEIDEPLIEDPQPEDEQEEQFEFNYSGNGASISDSIDPPQGQHAVHHQPDPAPAQPAAYDNITSAVNNSAPATASAPATEPAPDPAPASGQAPQFEIELDAYAEDVDDVADAIVEESFEETGDDALTMPAGGYTYNVASIAPTSPGNDPLVQAYGASVQSSEKESVSECYYGSSDESDSEIAYFDQDDDASFAYDAAADYSDPDIAVDILY